MRIGASLFLIAVGAILKFAVTDKVNGINLAVVGVILMVVGIVGLLFELIMWGTHRNTAVVGRAPVPTSVPPAEPIDRTY
jgi:hypothetical protein